MKVYILVFQMETMMDILEVFDNMDLAEERRIEIISAMSSCINRSALKVVEKELKIKGTCDGKNKSDP